MSALLPTPQLNLLAAWLGILLGFASGLILGLFFHREDWLGGYSSLKRRLYRLAHISFFGLGAVNLFFYFTVQRLSAAGLALGVAGWAFVLGAASMPLCCVLMAHWPRAHPLFAVPVLSLLLGASLTVGGIIQADRSRMTPEHSRGTHRSSLVPLSAMTEGRVPFPTNQPSL
jgi:hypothetical protein